MPVFADARCKKCGHRFGWTGRFEDKPPCPRCGHHDRVTAADVARLEKTKATFAAFHDAQRMVKSPPEKLPEVSEGPWEDMLDELADIDSGLWSSEIDFVESLDSLRGSKLSPKQLAWLKKIWERLTK